MAILYQLTAYFFQVLTPAQRYQSMRRIHTDPTRSVSTASWLVFLGWILIGLLVILFFVVRRIRLEKERLAMESRFRDGCDACRLTAQEREILETICCHAGLKKIDKIFEDMGAFDTGFAHLIHESFSAGHNLKQRKQLNIIVQGLKAKLGFQKSEPTSDGAVLAPRKMSSRQITEGRDVHVEVVTEYSIFCFDARVIRNDSYVLILQPAIAVEVLPGQTAQVQYKVGAMTWVFESTVIACGSGGLELNHNDHAKFVNRRRFPRVTVEKKAKVALFDMSQTITGEIQPPKFEDATVTEISGPGLQIQTYLNVKLYDRILVVFEPEEGRIVQDIAEVRGFREIDSVHSIAVEMIGLNENVVNDLIRITNQIATAGGRKHSCPENEDQTDGSGDELIAEMTRQKGYSS